MIRFALVSLLACLLGQPEKASESPRSAEPDLRGGTVAFEASMPAALEVKRVKTGHLLVKPVINGISPGWFIFDTGAGICVISTPHVKELDLKDAGPIDASGVGGQAKLHLYRAKKLTLGPATFEDHPLMETDLSFLSPLMGEEIAGVIGYGVLSRCIVEMDLATPRISLASRDGYTLPRGEWSELIMKERIPCVRAAFEGHEGVFRLDTGSDAFVTFHEPAVRRLNLLEGRDVKSIKLGGVGGFVKGKEGQIEWFEVGGVRQKKIKASFAIEAKGNYGEANKDGNIGAAMLKPFVLVLDYTGNHIAFLKRDAGAAEKERP